MLSRFLHRRSRPFCINDAHEPAPPLAHHTFDEGLVADILPDWFDFLLKAGKAGITVDALNPVSLVRVHGRPRFRVLFSRVPRGKELGLGQRNRPDLSWLIASRLAKCLSF